MVSMKISPRCRPLFLASAVSLFLAAPLGCSLFNGSSTGHNNSGGGGGSTVAPNFSNTVFIGDSLTAGFQNGSLLDKQQPNGWANLVATQAKFAITLPLIAPPGAPAVLELVSVGPPPVVQQSSGTTTGRDNANQQPTDLAVPGHKLNDLINAAPTAAPTSNEDIITDLVLGFPVGNNKSQMNEAIQLNPTTLFLWIGSDDALQADEAGTPSAMTPLTDFTTQYTQLIATLHTQTKATLIIGNIPDVTAIPYLTPADQVIADVAAQTGLSDAQVAPLLGIQTGDLVNPTGIQQAMADLQVIKQGGAPTPLTDSGFLSTTEIAQVQQTVDAYNTVIAQQAAAVGALVVDIHSLFQNLAAGITINNYKATNTFLGGLFSLDGEHPTNTGYALVANQFIDALNTSAKTSIPDVNVSAVASADPLFGPNIKPQGTASYIPFNAGLHADPSYHPRHRY
jgi:lysophospholipase L1-like esterase